MHTRSTPSSAGLVWLVILAGWMPPLLAAPRTDAADTLPANLGHSLRQLVLWHRAQPRNLSSAERRTRLMRSLPGRAQRLQTNADATRAVVDVTLDGTQPAETIKGNLSQLGVQVFASGKSILSAQLPLDQAQAAASLPGIRSITLVRRPWKRIGKVTTTGTFTLDFSPLNDGSGGSGMTVGVISDSFDVATLDTEGKTLTIHASDDVASGDLPGPGNPNGHLTPVHVLVEGDTGDHTNLDEGRAMLQIIHDLAPSANLAFAAAGSTPESFADSIRALRADPTTPCDVIADDITFPEEPMFYDGPVAQAVDDVVHGTTLPGRKAMYYSAAGNSGDLGYAASFAPVAVDDAPTGNLKLDQVPGELLGGTLHNFDVRSGKITVGQMVKVSDQEAEVDLQWDSAPGQTGPTAADFNLLVFDKDGNYLPDLSGTDKNIVLGNALEIVDLPAGTDGATAVYQLVISCASRATEDGASHLRYVVNSNGRFTAKFAGHNAPTIFGHAATVGADAVAAYDAPYAQLEPYSSFGPVTIYFDRDGNAQPAEVRQQPTLAAVDGVNTTFFGEDTDGDGFPNFYGTSAAAPHAAACAASLLQAAGGPGSLTNQQVRALLQGSAKPYFTDPNMATFTATDNAGTTLTLTEVRNDLDPAGLKNFFRLSFQGPATQRLSKLVLTLNQSGLTFDESNTGLPFTVGAVSGGIQKDDVTGTTGSVHVAGITPSTVQHNQLTLAFAPDSFGPGMSVQFGAGIKNLRADPRGLDPLSWAMLGTTIKAKFTGASGKTKAVNPNGVALPSGAAGWSPAAGAGLIDYGKALRTLQGGPPDTPDSRAALTPGNLLLTDLDNGALIESSPTGKVVQQFAVVGAQASTVLANGKVASLCKGSSGPTITLLDPLTRATTIATYPGW